MAGRNSLFRRSAAHMAEKEPADGRPMELRQICRHIMTAYSGKRMQAAMACIAKPALGCGFL